MKKGMHIEVAHLVHVKAWQPLIRWRTSCYTCRDGTPVGCWRFLLTQVWWKRCRSCQCWKRRNQEWPCYPTNGNLLHHRPLVSNPTFDQSWLECWRWSHSLLSSAMSMSLSSSGRRSWPSVTFRRWGSHSDSCLTRRHASEWCYRCMGT